MPVIPRTTPSADSELADNEEPKLSIYTLVRTTQTVEVFDILAASALDARRSPNREHRKTTTLLLHESYTKKES